MNKYSQLRATLTITNASLRSMTRNLSSIVFSIIFPIIFIVIFGVLGTGSSEFKVYITQESQQSFVYNIIESITSIKKVSYDTLEKAQEDLKIGKIDGIIDIKIKNSQTILDLNTSKASSQNGMALQSILKGITYEINYKENESSKATLQLSEIEGREYKQIDFFLPGQLGFALLNSGIFGSAFVILSLKETLVLKRFFATPIKKVNILIGEGLARLIFSTIQAVIIILVGKFFFDFTLVNGFETLIEMTLLSVFGLTVFLGMGLMISSISKDQNSIAPIANLFTLPQFLLGGVFFSTDILPQWLQPLTKVLPLTHLNEAMREIAFEGADISQIAVHLLVLFIWTVVVYGITAKMFKWDK